MSLTRPVPALGPSVLQAIVILAVVAVLATLTTVLLGAGPALPAYELSLDTIALPF